MIASALPLLFAALMQQQPMVPGALRQVVTTSPPSGDTVGYWQQKVEYRIVARLDEPGQRLRSRAEVMYVNNSPDTLREMYVHQYLNAFRPHSRWSEADEREGRERFQHLRDPDYGYERFTSPPVVDGSPVFVEYPGAPDSTVAHFKLPRPLTPHDTMHIFFEWDARPSTIPRRQGRRGRAWDFAQWYPKIAVYDRAGWEANPLVPAGELYGEYGTYDVTLILPQDQVVGATGVPVSGDPGWQRVQRWGTLRSASDAYDSLPPAPAADVPTGMRAVRFVARNVHHFAWSVSPDYRYEGGLYIRQLPPTHYKTWDTVSINVLYKPGDDTTWGGGRAVQRTMFALRWLESIWGPFAYPQMTNLHRIEGGGTEFPMMVMNGSASQGLILHEVGHNFTYGILGNNEWRSGWMDEGLTSYQTSWALGVTPQERARSGVPPAPPRIQTGYRANAVVMPPADSVNLEQIRLDLAGAAQPIGTPAMQFRDFGIYNQMIYSRAELMYSHLRDALGDTAFRSFFHDYYDRWALKHVDELAMRASAERKSGRDLQWFFNEWVHDTGIQDYALIGVHTSQRSDGQWVTRADLVRRGEYRHPVPVGAHTASGWTLARGDVARDSQTVEIVTAQKPDSVRIDPYHYTWDWDWRNNVPSTDVLGIRNPRVVVDWPFLDQADREHSIVGVLPMLWYSEPARFVSCPTPSGGTGTCNSRSSAVTVGLRAQSSYLTTLDRWEYGLAVSAGGDMDAASRINAWARTENPYLTELSRPLMGFSADAAFLDGIGRFDIAQRWDLSPFYYSNGPTIAVRARLTGAYPTDSHALPEQWSNTRVTELSGDFSFKSPEEMDGSYFTAGGSLAGGLWSTASTSAHAYARGELYGSRVQVAEAGRFVFVGRVYGAATDNSAPLQRRFFASAADPLASFWNPWYRPRGALLKQLEPTITFLPLGGAMLRGYSPYLALGRVLAINGELSQRALRFVMQGTRAEQTIWLSAFGDVGTTRLGGADGRDLADAGAGVAWRGRLYDRDVKMRFDFPILVKQPTLSIGEGHGGHGSLAFRWAVSLDDLW